MPRSRNWIFSQNCLAEFSVQDTTPVWRHGPRHGLRQETQICASDHVFNIILSSRQWTVHDTTPLQHAAGSPKRFLHRILFGFIYLFISISMFPNGKISLQYYLRQLLQWHFQTSWSNSSEIWIVNFFGHKFYWDRSYQQSNSLNI